MKDLDSGSWDDMPDLNSFQAREYIRFKQALTTERPARAKFEDAVKAAGLTDRGTVRGDDTVERTPLFQKVYSGRHISDERLREFIGRAPFPAYNRDGDRYALGTGPMPHDPVGTMPIPVWDGSDFANKVKP